MSQQSPLNSAAAVSKTPPASKSKDTCLMDSCDNAHRALSSLFHRPDSGAKKSLMKYRTSQRKGGSSKNHHYKWRFFVPMGPLWGFIFSLPFAKGRVRERSGQTNLNNLPLFNILLKLRNPNRVARVKQKRGNIFCHIVKIHFRAPRQKLFF